MRIIIINVRTSRLLQNCNMSIQQISFDSRLNGDFLNELYGGDNEHASIVFEQFLGSIHNQLKEMEINFNSGDPELLRKKVHLLKPVFSFVGLTELTDKAQIIENQCMLYSDTKPIEALFIDFKTSVLKAIPIIENEFIKLQKLNVL